jgi:hypothetical protein
MGISKKIRNIAISQLGALKDRLDKIELEDESGALAERRATEQARAELDELGPSRSSLRRPEEIAPPTQRPASESVRGATPTNFTRETVANSSSGRSTLPPVNSPTGASAMIRHYRVLGLPDGSDMLSVQEAYESLMARCAPDRFPEGAEEQKAADEIRKRVEESYEELRDYLDATAGRFDKLEL